jgi:serine/threonine protein kinase
MNEREIFVKALGYSDPDERSAFLEQACEGDRDLRQRIEALLLRHTEASQFLEQPAVEAIATELVSGHEENFHAASGDTLPELETRTLEFLAPSDNPDALGQLGQYQILEVIGRGGMGIVLRGVDPKLNRVVAIKVLSPDFAANPTAHKRFVREAQAIAAVSHDHIVTIYAVEEQPVPHLVMEYIDGKSLQQKIDKDGQLELKEVLRIARQVAAGLSAAHEQGLTHRDIKPSNILLQNGVQRVQITDFGLARATADADITRTGEIAGTPQYMSPEQARSESVDPRSDLFSLGSVMYAMCCGRSPFRADTPYGSIKRVCEDEPRSLRENNPEIPTWLEAVIFKLLEKDPGDRFQSAREVGELLGKHLSHLHDPGSTPFPGKLQVEPTRRKLAHPRLVASVAVIVLALLTVGFTEAVGVTNFTGTVIRMATGEGTLVIEVDDPSVEVSLDGEELSITGAGLQELKLRPGQYQFQATKDGQPIEQKLVSISRGDREVVRVSREWPSPSASLPAGAVDSDVFVVLDGTGKQAGKFDTLEKAVLGSNPGDTIEIRGNGPFATRGIIIRHPLTIRAGEGYRPVIHHTEKSPNLKGSTLLQTDSPVALEGLELQSFVPNEPKGNIITASTTIRLLNCRIFDPRGDGAGCLHTFGNVHLKNSLLIQPGHGSSLGGLGAPETRCQNNVFVGPIRIYAGTADPAYPESTSSIVFKNNTMVVPHGYSLGLGLLADKVENGSIKQIQSQHNLTVAEVVMNLNLTRVLDADYTVDEAFSRFKTAFSWSESANLYQKPRQYLRLRARDGSEMDIGAEIDLSAFQEFWNQEDSGSREGLIRFQGGDPISRFRSDDTSVTAADFRLREDSAGYQAGPDGQDIGADIDFVGPGEAYERWKQTDEYRQWRLETREMMQKPTQTASAGTSQTSKSAAD